MSGTMPPVLTSRTSLASVSLTDDAYRLPDGSVRTRVTRIIGALAKPALDGWSARLAAEYAVSSKHEWADLDDAEAVALIKGASARYADRTAKLGTAVHGAVEDVLLTGASIYEQPKELLGHLRGWQAFCELYSPTVLGSEVLFCGPGYAGTADLVLQVDLGDGHGERLVIGDTKTGKSVHGESVALQLAAYRHATHAVLDGRVVANPWAGLMTGGVVVHLRPRSAGLYTVACGKQVYQHFLYAQQSFLWVNEYAPRALGPRQVLDPSTVPVTPNLTTEES